MDYIMLAHYYNFEQGKKIVLNMEGLTYNSAYVNSHGRGNN